MHFPQFLQVALTDAGALGQQALEDLRARLEGYRLLHQRAVALEGLAEGRAQRHRIALVTGPLTQLVPRLQDLGALGREGVHRRAMAPSVHHVTDFPGDADDRVVVRRRVSLDRLSTPFAGSRPMPLLFPGIAPFAIGRVVERRLLGLRTRPALRQIRPHVAVCDRNVCLRMNAAAGCSATLIWRRGFRRTIRCGRSGFWWTRRWRFCRRI